MYPARVTWGLLAALAVILLTSAGPSSASSSQSLTLSSSSASVDWFQPLGAESAASANAVSADETGVYVVGMVQGVLPGQTSSGSPYGYHGFIRKYSHGGLELWTRQLDMEDDEHGRASAVHASGVYVAGSIRGELPEGGPPGFSDAFVRLYDRDGNEVWTRRLGLPGGAFDGTSAYGIDAGGTGVYVAGRYPDGVFLRKLTHDGDDLWQVELPAFNAWATSVSANESGVYIAGTTGAALPGQESAGDGDIFIAAYSHEGDSDRSIAGRTRAAISRRACPRTVGHHES